MQLDKAQEYKLLKPVYALNFVNDTFETSEEMANEYFHHYKIVNIHHTEKQIEGLEFIYVELPKFKPLNRAEKALHELWLRFLTEINETTEEVPKELLENELICEAVEYMKVAAYTKAQLDTYYKVKIDTMTASGMLSASKAEGEAIGMEKGKAIGIEKGEAIGMEKGKAIGIETGKAIGEREKAITVALKALEMGLSIEAASQLSGLSKIEIEKLTGIPS